MAQCAYLLSALSGDSQWHSVSLCSYGGIGWRDEALKLHRRPARCSCNIGPKAALQRRTIRPVHPKSATAGHVDDFDASCQYQLRQKLGLWVQRREGGGLSRGTVKTISIQSLPTSRALSL
jgi:hypothetical protein